MKQIEFFAAFWDIALLTADFRTRGTVHTFFHLKQIREFTDDRKSDFVAVFADSNLTRLTEAADNFVRQVVHFIPRQLHRIAAIPARCADNLTLSHKLVLNLAEHVLVRNTLPPHVVAILIQQVADLIVKLIFDRKISFNDQSDHFSGRRRIAGLEGARTQARNQLPGQVAY